MRKAIIFSSLLLFLGVVVALMLASTAMSGTAASIVVHQSTYGRVVFDGRGFALYAFTRDSRGDRSTCSGLCAKAWPPYVVKAKPVAGAGAKSSLISAVRRSDGSLQVTYAGRPLYYYQGDKKPGQILCQDVSEFGGLWLVVRANGSLVR